MAHEMLVFSSGVSLLFATAFALAFLTLACAPALLTYLWQVVKWTAVASVGVHLVRDNWPSLYAQIGGPVAQLQDSVFTALVHGSRLLLPLLIG